MPYLFVTRKGRDPQVVNLENILNIGRDDINDLVLPVNDVSRIHASVVRNQDGRYQLLDQNSTNGVLLNDGLVDKCFLKHGDTFIISDYSFTYLENDRAQVDNDQLLERALQQVHRDAVDSTVIMKRKALKTMLHEDDVGLYLKHLRREKGISTEEASRITRVSSTIIKAIESHNYANLPADAFSKALIGMYADFLGVDGTRMAEAFFSQRDEQHQSQKKHSLCGKSHKQAQDSSDHMARPWTISPALVAAGILLIIVLSFTGFSLYTSYNPLSSLVKKTDELHHSLYETLKTQTDPIESGTEKMTDRLQGEKTSSGVPPGNRR